MNKKMQAGGGIFKIVYACWWVKNTEMSKFIDDEQDVDQL